MDSSEYLYISPTINEIGDWVTITFTISNYTSGSLYISLNTGNVSSPAYTSTGTYSFSGQVTDSPNTYFKSVNFNGTIEAVSVIEAIPDRCVQGNHLQLSTYAGSELVTNGTFDTDVSGWTNASVGTGTATWDSGTSSCKLTRDGSISDRGIITQSVGGTTSKTYKIEFDSLAGSTGIVAIRVNSIVLGTGVTAGSTFTGYYISDSVDLIEFLPGTNTSIVYIDNISVTEVKHGELNKTAVATGAELMGYSGWSPSNYATLPYTSDLDNGTDAFKYQVHLKEAANSAVEVIFERDSATTTQRITAQVNADGTVSFICDDDTTVRTATSTGTVDDSTWHKLEFEYSAGTLNIYIDNVLDGTATGAALLTLSNATAVLNVGLDVQGANPLTNGTLALFKTTKTIGTTANRTSDYQAELPLFQASAACTLSGSSDSVLALDYDEHIEKVTVLTDVIDVFDGLENVDQGTFNGTAQCVSADNNSTLIGTSTEASYDRVEGWY